MEHRFTLTREFIALNDLLKLTGICSSGGEAKAVIASEAVRVNGELELRKTYKVRAGDVIELDGVKLVVDAG